MIFIPYSVKKKITLNTILIQSCKHNLKISLITFNTCNAFKIIDNSKFLKIVISVVNLKRSFRFDWLYTCCHHDKLFTYFRYDTNQYSIYHGTCNINE